MHFLGSEGKGDEFSAARGTKGSKGSFKAYHQDLSIS